MLSDYHQQYSEKSDDDVASRLHAKESELAQVFTCVKPPVSSPLRVAVLGCADRRLVDGHRRIYEHALGASVELTTFDITIEHLAGESGVLQHDCTIPLPGGPFDITYAHVLLNFLPPDKQWDVIWNSYQALKPGGSALHVLDLTEIESTSPTLPDGCCSVPLAQHEVHLAAEGISYADLSLTSGPDRTDRCRALVLLRG